MIKSWTFEFIFADQDIQQAIMGAGANPSAEVCETYASQIIPYFAKYLDLWASAEDLGYHGVLLSEHHFGGGYSPSPNLLLPLIAQRTSTIRLGVMGMVASYHNPWRLVEEVGMLDILTQGRLDVGTSAGIPAEFARIGMEPAEARARYDEALQVIDEGLRNPVLTHHGKYWNFDNLTLVPRPVQHNIPVWTTVLSVESARKAARRGSKIVTGFLSTEKVREVFDAYREEAVKAGNPAGPEQLGLRRQVIIETPEEARTGKARGIAMALKNRIEDGAKKAGGAALDRPGAHSYTIGEEEFIIGSPTAIAEEISKQCREIGAEHFQVVFTGLTTFDERTNSMEIYGREIIPLLGEIAEAGVGGARSVERAHA
jgi:alkanesulfonate monooxygenase SsuD/methylene tetrahydromethanopterin reductase-like flavin-dependent oxidoreductase (luciferase family)